MDTNSGGGAHLVILKLLSYRSQNFCNQLVVRTRLKRKRARFLAFCGAPTATSVQRNVWVRSRSQRRAVTFDAYRWRSCRIPVASRSDWSRMAKDQICIGFRTTYSSGLGRIEKNRICVVQTDMKRSDTGRIGAKKSDSGRIGLQSERSLSITLTFNSQFVC